MIPFISTEEAPPQGVEGLELAIAAAGDLDSGCRRARAPAASRRLMDPNDPESTHSIPLFAP
jgi:hypothetical protein